MKLSTYLMFDGRCEDALRFYEKHLGGKIAMMMTYGESPMGPQTPPDWGKKILHATIALGDQTVGAADAFPGSYQKPQGFYVVLAIEGAAEAERTFAVLAEGGTVHMPVQETFWALRFGMLADRFGTPWMINCGKPH